MVFLPNPLILPLGLLIGILVSAPVGPVNILCIHRAVSRGFWGGLAAGIGAALGDSLIALAASLGVGAMPDALSNHRLAIQAVGGLALMGFGFRLYLEPPYFDFTETEVNGKETLRKFLWDIPKAFLLTVTNPSAVLGLFAIFSGVSSFLEISSPVSAFIMVLAVAAGSLIWWTGLSYVIGRVRHRFNRASLNRVNQGAGILLLGFGLLLLGELAFTLLLPWLPHPKLG